MTVITRSVITHIVNIRLKLEHYAYEKSVQYVTIEHFNFPLMASDSMEQVLYVVIFMKETVEGKSQTIPCKLTRFSITSLLNTFSLRPPLMDLTVDQRIRLFRHCSRFSIFSNSVYFRFEQLLMLSLGVLDRLLKFNCPTKFSLSLDRPLKFRYPR